MRSFLMGLRDLWDVVFVFHPPEWPEVRALRAGQMNHEFGVGSAPDTLVVQTTANPDRWVAAHLGPETYPGVHVAVARSRRSWWDWFPVHTITISGRAADIAALDDAARSEALEQTAG